MPQTRIAPTGVWGYRHLILNFTERDLKARFRGTAIGWLWSLILPVAQVAIYTLVFSVIIRLEPPPMGSGEGAYVPWLMAGMVPWGFLSAGSLAGINALLTNGSMLQKVYFPAYVPTVASVLATGVQSVIELIVVAAVLAAFGNIGVSILLIPIWMLLVLVFVACLNYCFALWHIRFRDVGHLAPIIMQLLFFLSPVIYPADLVPETWNGIPLHTLMALNPFASFIDIARSLLYDLSWGAPTAWLSAVAWVLGAAAVAVATHRRLGRDVGELI